MYKLTFFSIVLIITIIACNRNSNASKDISNVILYWDTSKYIFKDCIATVDNGNVRLLFKSHPDSLDKYELEVLKSGDRITTEMRQTWAMTDCLYVVSRFKVLKQDIRLDKKVYKKDDDLEGQLNLLFLGHKDYFREPGEDTLRQDFDTVRLLGKIRAKIQ